MGCQTTSGHKFNCRLQSAATCPARPLKQEHSGQTGPLLPAPRSKAAAHGRALLERAETLRHENICPPEFECAAKTKLRLHKCST